MESMSDQEKIQTLQAEVEVLQYKLHELHATDVNTLRRGYLTVAQHVDALKIEAARLEALVEELEPELYPPEFIAEECGKAAVVSGAVYGVFTIVKTITPVPSKAGRWLRNGLFAVTAIIVTWRFARSSIGRFAALLLDHKRRRRALLRELAALQQRVDMLAALTSTMPGVSEHLQRLRTRSAPPAPKAAAAAAAMLPAAAAAGGRDAGGPSTFPEQSPFVVVDLPRVESGGFVLHSPTVASPAPDLVVVGMPAAAAGGGASASGAAVSGWQDPSSSSSGSSSAPGQEITAAAGSGGSSHDEPVTGVPVTAAFVYATQQQEQQQQYSSAAQQPQQQEASSSSTAAAAAVDATAPAPAAAVFVPPSSVFGWGGVLTRQVAPQPQQQQQQGHAESTAAAAAVSSLGRQPSPETDEGEWVDQPGVLSDDNGGSSSNNGSGGEGEGQQRQQQREQQQQQQWGGSGGRQQASPEVSSDEAVLLERE